MQPKFLALRYNRFSPQNRYSYEHASEHLNFHILCARRRHLSAHFLVFVYNIYKFFPSLLEPAGIRVISLNFGHLPLFTLGSSSKNFPSANRALATYSVFKNIHVGTLSKYMVMLKHILKHFLQ